MAMQSDMPILKELIEDTASFCEQQTDMLAAVFRYLVDLEATLRRMVPGAASQDAQGRFVENSEDFALFPASISGGERSDEGDGWAHPSHLLQPLSF